MIENFDLLDIRSGTILRAELFPEAKKPAYKLWIDFGEKGILKSSAQITEIYNPESLQNKKIVAIVNLQPRQVGPFISECLVLGVMTTEGVVLLQPDQEVGNGLKIK